MPELFEIMVADYMKFDCNSIILQVLNKLFLTMSKLSSCAEITKILFLDSQLCEKFCGRFSLSEF